MSGLTRSRLETATADTKSLLAPPALAVGDFAGFVADFAFHAVFSAVISTALPKVMFVAGGMMQAGAAVGCIRQVMDAPSLEESVNPQEPSGNKIEFRNVSFTYEGADGSHLLGGERHRISIACAS